MKRTLELDRVKPHNQTLLTSADSNYFNTYGPALFQSAVDANTSIHFNVIQPDSAAANLVLKMANREKDNRVTFSFTYTDFLDKVDPKVYYCCDRFLLARDLLAMDPGLSVVTVDIDSLVINPFPILDIDLGLWLRPHEVKGMNLLAGMCYFSDLSLDFVYTAAIKMNQTNFKNWFDDQKALWETYQEYDFDGVEFRDFAGSKYLDWEWKSDSNIWTGKGARKHTDPVYVAKFNEFSERFKNG